MSTRLFFSGGCLAVALLVSSAAAQDRYLSETYGEGVHSFFQGSSALANSRLSQAIDMGFDDPRAYYFRAINKMLSGDIGGAEGDIRSGAILEVNGTGTYNIGRALERVQGPHRLRFEHSRREAILVAQQAKANQAPRPSGDREYLRDPVPAEPMDLPPTAVPPAPAEDDPFLTEEDPDEVIDEPAEDPAMDDAGEIDEVDPFADEDMLDEPAAEEAAPEDDVLGDEGAGEDDMFGDEDVFGEEPAAEGAADEAAEGAADEAAEEVPPAEVDEDATGDEDIFGEEGDDMFGEEEAVEGEVPQSPSDALEGLFE